MEDFHRHKDLFPLEKLARSDRGACPMRTPEQILAERKKTLFSLKGDISTALSDALGDKIDYEHGVLSALLAEAKNAESAKRTETVLRSEYFTKKALDTSTL